MAELVVDNPYTLETACRVPLADRAEVDRIIERARVAALEARETQVAERVALCLRAVEAIEARAAEIAADISRTMGKPLAQSHSEVKGMASRARYMASVAERSLADIVIEGDPALDRRIRKEPLGVVVDLPAWNYPLLTAVNVVVPAVLAGNAVVVKHSPRSPLCGPHFADAFRAAGAPAALVQSLDCDHPTSEAMVGDRRVGHVVFTGSVYGGRRIQAAAAGRFLHVGLELGGNDPAYVAPDCDLEAAVAGLVDGAMYNAGQSCCAVERVYVHRSIYDRFIAATEALVRAYRLGDPFDAETTLGPVAQPHHVAELTAFVTDARDRGARVVCGGEAQSVGGRGRLFAATLLADVPADARVMREESFGPLLPVAPVDSEDDAVDRMNDSSLGLTAGIWTRDRERAERLAARLEAGTIYMNRCDAVDPALPWGGVKDSGRGFSLSALGFDQLTRPKSLNFRVG